MALANAYCVSCRRGWALDAPDRICPDCRRYRAIGVLVASAACLPANWDLDVLDAVGELLGTATRLRRVYTRYLTDEERARQREASAAYDEGFLKGLQSTTE